MAPAPGGKRTGEYHGDGPCVVVARDLLRRRLRAIRRVFPKAAKHPERDIEYVHQLRVAVRRCEAALRLFREFCEPRSYARIRNHVRKVRRAAGAARQDDVAAGILAVDSASADRERQSALGALIRHVVASRTEAQESIEAVAARRRRGVSGRDVRRLIGALRVRPKTPSASTGDGNESTTGSPFTLAELARRELPLLIDAVRFAQGRDLSALDDVHQLRIATKKLRYAMEVFSRCLPRPAFDRLYPFVTDIQGRLGDINDYHEITLRIQARVRESGGKRKRTNAALAALADHYRQERDRRHRAVSQWWGSPETTELLDELCSLARRADASCGTVGENTRVAAAEAIVGPSDAGPGLPLHRRVAAIDVGTNSLRLVVAETDPATRFRIIEDMKEATRLGSGVYRTGKLDPEAAEKSLAALEKMKRIADDYHVSRLRAIGTSALREASDADEFVGLAARRAGVDIDVVDPEHEARLAFSSVVNAFDLEDRRVAVADIGGGSTELVFSSDGVINAIHSLPLGAIRLAEMFCRESEDKGCDFEEMCRAVDDAIQKEVDPPSHPLELLIGTGGTFTTLARVSMRGGNSGSGGRFPFAVRGYELRRQDVSAVLTRLRRMTPAERRNVPGLSTQRSEIIVPGLCIVERVMEHLGMGRLRIHDGGIRDGLLSEMIDDLGIHPFLPRRRAVQMVDMVRGFAERSRYERDHSEHVARLALQVFDQLAGEAADASGTWASRHCRNLLQAGAVAHDVGMLIERKNHHKHSYEMLIHADLSSLTHREIELIANIARYHRGPGPRPDHPNFRHLGDDDQRLVRHLAGILRIADGLDRPRTQNVTGVTIVVDADCVRFEAHADGEPSANLESAMRKADVFEDAFHIRPKFRWLRAPARAAAVRLRG